MEAYEGMECRPAGGTEFTCTGEPDAIPVNLLFLVLVIYVIMHAAYERNQRSH